jgi:leucyl-tRNA synthetase
MYLAFMGPYQGSNYPWDMGGIAGIRRFLERVNGLTEHIVENEPEISTCSLHKTIKKVSSDIVEFKFNTAISAMMIYINTVEEHGLSTTSYKNFLCLLAPFAPHLTEELWSEMNTKGSIHEQTYPQFDETLTVDETVEIGVQINGKMRGSISIARTATEDGALSVARNNLILSSKIENVEIKRVIYVPGKILNIVGVENVVKE